MLEDVVGWSRAWFAFGLLGACGPSVISTSGSGTSGGVVLPASVTTDPDSDDTSCDDDGVVPCTTSTGSAPCLPGTVDCLCDEDARCDPGLECMRDRNLCGPESCVEEPWPQTTVRLDEGGRLSVLDVAWFDFWGCSLYAGFDFRSAGAENSVKLVVTDPVDWSSVEPGLVSTLEPWDEDVLLDYGTVEVIDIERTPLGVPIAVVGSVAAGTAAWTLEGTFRATACGNGWGPGFPCE